MRHVLDPRRRGLGRFAAAAVVSVCASFAPAGPVDADAPLNHLQAIGTHNSYKRGAQPELVRLYESTLGVDLSSLDYSHLPLADQLNLGLRGLELDVYHDPDGGRFTPPASDAFLRAAGIEPEPWDPDGEALTPGFKVIHDLDADFRTWHVSLEDALAALRTWSEAHPGHGLVMVTMNCKWGERRIPLAPKGGEFTPEVLLELDRAIEAGLGRDRLLTPGGVRRESPTLRDALDDRGWPSLRECAGRFLFVLDHGGSILERYREARPDGDGVFFVLAEPGEPDSGVLIINDPVRDEAKIRGLVERGYLVRTRADAGTAEARRNDYTRFEAAKRAGAHFIYTDYAIPDRSISDRFMIRFDDNAFERENPVTVRPPTNAIED